VGVLGMLGVGDGVDHLVEAGDVAAIFGRSVVVAREIAGIADAGLAESEWRSR
jgi:hypothetical protein